MEPEKPMILQAPQNIHYGNAMQESDIATIRASLQNILDVFMPSLKSAPPNSSAFLDSFKSIANWPIVIGMWSFMLIVLLQYELSSGLTNI